jgi:hypothetical protein
MTTDTATPAPAPATSGTGQRAGTPPPGPTPAAGEAAEGGLPTAGQVAAAEKDMTALLSPPAAPAEVKAAAVAAARVAVVAGMAALGAGVRLAAAPGGWRVAGGVCAGLLLAHGYAGATRASQKLAARLTAASAAEPWWLASARICERSQQGWADPAVLAAAAAHLAAVSRRYASAHLYVARCDPDRHPGLCREGTVEGTGGRLVLVIGEHLAAAPAVAAVVIAHECGHKRPWARAAGGLVLWARAPWAGWGWAAAGLAGWPWLLAAVPAFHVASVLGLWAVESGCDLGAARAHGCPAVLDALAFKPAHATLSRAQTLAYWLAGPTHPPVRLRQAVIRTRQRLAHARTTLRWLTTRT